MYVRHSPRTARTPIPSPLTRLPSSLLTPVLKTQFKLLPKAFNSLITQCVWERKADKASLVSFMVRPDTSLLAVVPKGLHYLGHGGPVAPAQPRGHFQGTTVAQPPQLGLASGCCHPLRPPSRLPPPGRPQLWLCELL